MHRRRWTRDDDLETTLPRDEFTCRSSALAFGKRILSMVVGKALCRLFQLPHLSHGEHASGRCCCSFSRRPGKKDEDINVTAGVLLVGWHCHQTGHLCAVVGHERLSLVTNSI